MLRVQHIRYFTSIWLTRNEAAVWRISCWRRNPTGFWIVLVSPELVWKIEKKSSMRKKSNGGECPKSGSRFKEQLARNKDTCSPSKKSFYTEANIYYSNQGKNMTHRLKRKIKGKFFQSEYLQHFQKIKFAFVKNKIFINFFLPVKLNSNHTTRPDTTSQRSDKRVKNTLRSVVFGSKYLI